jgi:hypothetical protein
MHFFLILAMTNAVRHCMEYRFQRFDTSKTTNTILTARGAIKDPLESILEQTDLMNVNEVGGISLSEDVASLLAAFIRNPESVLQELDIQRLRAIIYRDVVRPERNKAGKNVVVIVVNVILVLLHASLLFKLIDGRTIREPVFLFCRTTQNSLNS